jgi:LDH2 family malate/lactate/ureidoglycolate dehydrogenase
MQSLGGILAGIYKPEFQKPKSPWESNQGAFIAIFDVNHFMPVSELKKEMDRYINEARSMKPLPNMDQAELAGGLEWQWALENKQSGIPLSFEHQGILETVATELAVDVPFNRYQHTRF